MWWNQSDTLQRECAVSALEAARMAKASETVNIYNTGTDIYKIVTITELILSLLHIVSVCALKRTAHTFRWLFLSECVDYIVVTLANF